MADDAMPWPADAVQRRPIADLIPNARNARTHSDGQVAQLAGSIREWGWTIPVLVDEAGTLIAGHGRVLAAHQLGLTEVPTMVAAGWSDAKKRAYMLADNKLAENAGWDDELLRSELVDLLEAGFTGDLLGFDADELALTLDGWDSDLGDGLAGDPDGMAGLGAKLTISFNDENKDRLGEVREAVMAFMAEHGIAAMVSA